LKVLASAVSGRFNRAVRNYDGPEIAAQVDKIRAEIRQYGESRVGCDELLLLCPNEVSANEQLTGIAQIAQWERWSFEYFPDGSVRFTNL
jgi:hypothetical protein